MVKVYDNPINPQVMTKVENVDAGRIVNILDRGDHYEVHSYKLMNGDWRLHDIDSAPNYACAFLRANRFAETGKLTE